MGSSFTPTPRGTLDVSYASESLKRNKLGIHMPGSVSHWSRPPLEDLNSQVLFSFPAAWAKQALAMNSEARSPKEVLLLTVGSRVARGTGMVTRIQGHSGRVPTSPPSVPNPAELWSSLASIVLRIWWLSHKLSLHQSLS